MYLNILCTGAPPHAAGALFYFFHPCSQTAWVRHRSLDHAQHDKGDRLWSRRVGLGTELSTFKGTDPLSWYYRVQIHVKSIDAKFQYLRGHLEYRKKKRERDYVTPTHFKTKYI